jgi:hypothetical protein
LIVFWVKCTWRAEIAIGINAATVRTRIASGDGFFLVIGTMASLA